MAVGIGARSTGKGDRDFLGSIVRASLARFGEQEYGS
jgi:hypothetical protein